MDTDDMEGINWKITQTSMTNADTAPCSRIPRHTHWGCDQQVQCSWSMARRWGSIPALTEHRQHFWKKRKTICMHSLTSTSCLCKKRIAFKAGCSLPSSTCTPPMLMPIPGSCLHELLIQEPTRSSVGSKIHLILTQEAFMTNSCHWNIMLCWRLLGWARQGAQVYKHDDDDYDSMVRE